MINQPECTECGSKEFVLREIIERIIDDFDKNNKPVDYHQKDVLESTIKCAGCGEPLEEKKRNTRKIRCHFCQEEGVFLGNKIKDFINFAEKNNWRKFVLSGDFKYACPKHIDQIEITDE
jgi:DNA-directed RNA polymerase subunit RPC12/RpoP